MIMLENGHTVLASIVNCEFDVDGKRKGAGVVVAFDREGYGGQKLYVTWTVYPTSEHSDLWIAETGNYGQTWEDAIADMIDRFNRYGFNRENVNA